MAQVTSLSNDRIKVYLDKFLFLKIMGKYLTLIIVLISLLSSCTKNSDDSQDCKQEFVRDFITSNSITLADEASLRDIGVKFGEPFGIQTNSSDIGVYLIVKDCDCTNGRFNDDEWRVNIVTKNLEPIAITVNQPGKDTDGCYDEDHVRIRYYHDSPYQARGVGYCVIEPENANRTIEITTCK